jgi:uncharacterized protein YcfJ
MRQTPLLTAIFATAAAAVMMPTPAPAADHHVYKGSSHRHRCKRSKGVTGLLAGAGGGGLAAAALGAGPVGLAAGVVGGGLLGRHLDKRHDAAQNRRNGC